MAPFPIYSCPECVVETMIGGQTLDCPLTFALNKDGVAVDPTTPDLLPLRF